MADVDQNPGQGRWGMYHLQDGSDTASCTSGLFSLLGVPDPRDTDRHYTRDQLRCLIDERLTDSAGDGLWRIMAEGEERFIFHRTEAAGTSIMGAMMDITHEVQRRRQIEYERDHDGMTGLLNRQAFLREAPGLLEREECAALVMLDIDDLKDINDVMGHEAGDLAILRLVECLKKISPEHALICRRSGDEFLLLVAAHHGREKLQEQIYQAWRYVRGIEAVIADGTHLPVRCSAGICWYPDQANDLDTLMKYADFELFRIKHGDKGHLGIFSHHAYMQGGFMRNCLGSLQQLLKHRSMSFVYQPIVRADTGETYGWEALMRPLLPDLRSPEMVVRLCEEKGLTHELEFITWECSLTEIDRLVKAGKVPDGTFFFINSIGDQMMTNSEAQSLEQRFGYLFPRVVMEITERQIRNLDSLRQKIRFFQKRGGRVALDDYGTGNSNELTLISARFDIVKLDISFIHNVDQDPQKQNVVHNLTNTAASRGMLVLGEGLQTQSDMDYLVQHGVSLLQGYYTGKPQDEPLQADEKIRSQLTAIARRERKP